MWLKAFWIQKLVDMVCFAHSFEAFVMKISILKEMPQASAQTATQALNKWDWTIGHFKKIQTVSNPNIKQASKKSKPVDTMQYKILSIMFLESVSTCIISTIFDV